MYPLIFTAGTIIPHINSSPQPFSAKKICQMTQSCLPNPIAASPTKLAVLRQAVRHLSETLTALRQCWDVCTCLVTADIYARKGLERCVWILKILVDEEKAEMYLRGKPEEDGDGLVYWTET